MITKERKKEMVAELQDKFQRAQATFLVDYRGIKVEGLTGLRKSLRDADVEFKVVRNLLARRAIKGTPPEVVSEHFVGPTAVAFSFTDAAQAAKALTKFAKDEPNFELKIGTLGSRILETDEIKALSALPSRDELLGSLVGVLAAVPTAMVRVLSAVPRDFVGVLAAIGREKEAAAG